MYQITVEHYIEQIYQRHPQAQFTVLHFINTKQPAMIRCEQCQNLITFTQARQAYDTRHIQLCSLCKSHYVQQTIKRCKENHFTILNNPGTVHKPWTFECNKCHFQFQRLITGDILKHCPNCDIHSTDKKYNTLEEWQAQFDKNFGVGEFTVLNTINPSSRKIAVRHKCGFVKITQAYALLNIKGCPKCSPKLSKGEQKIIHFLDDHHIVYTYQAQMGNTRQSFDFLINNNIAIEYNGEQHYKPITIFGGEQRFIQQQQFDAQKVIYCQEHNIELVVISYKDFANIDNILTSTLERLNDQTKVVAQN